MELERCATVIQARGRGAMTRKRTQLLFSRPHEADPEPITEAPPPRAEADRDVELGVGISGTHNVLGKARRVAQLLLAQCE